MAETEFLHEVIRLVGEYSYNNDNDPRARAPGLESFPRGRAILPAFGRTSHAARNRVLDGAHNAWAPSRLKRFLHGF